MRDTYVIKEKLKAALRPYGEVQSNTPLGVLCEEIAYELNELHRANAELKNDILNVGYRIDGFQRPPSPAPSEVAAELWKLLEKKNDTDKAQFIDGLNEL